MSNTVKVRNMLRSDLEDYASELQGQRDELLEALKHLEHNARKSGANMGLALDVASDAIAKSTAK